MGVVSMWIELGLNFNLMNSKNVYVIVYSELGKLLIVTIYQC